MAGSAITQPENSAFMIGNEVVARACLAAGADYMFGYPITPQNEIMHYWGKLAPRYGRGFLQTEDELSAGFATLGAVLVGKVAFSATAGPGTILFQEPLAMAEMMRLPVVVIVQQRGGPSTATVIYSQQEVNLCCYGGNGEGLRLVYSTSSHQELYDYTIKAFYRAWQYRFPALVLGDGYQAKMRESLMLYNPLDRWGPVPAEPILGRQDTVSHLRNAFSVEEELAEVLAGHLEDYEQAGPELVEHEFIGSTGAHLLVIAHGIIGRAARETVQILRKAGKKVNFFRPISLRPFPRTALREACDTSGRSILVVESSAGQLAGLVERALSGKSLTRYETFFRPGLGITAEEIEEVIQEVTAL